MIYLYIFLGLIAVLFLFSFLSVGRIPKYGGISYSNLSRYLTYLLEKALANGGTVHIQPEGMKGGMNITKREYVKKPAKVFITLSSGYIPRNDIAKVSERFKRDGIDHKLHYTNYHNALHRLTLGILFVMPLLPRMFLMLFAALCTHSAMTASPHSRSPYTVP